GGLFVALAEPSHDIGGRERRDLYREGLVLHVVKSCFCDFQNLLLNDGCAGVAVISSTGPMEVQFDEHKLLVVYASDLAPFERVMREHGVRRDDRLRLITEAEHLHSTDPRLAESFDQLCYRLGVGEAAERVNWQD